MDVKSRSLLATAIVVLVILAVGSLLLGFKAAELVDRPWRGLFDVVSIFLPAAIAWGSRRVGLPRMQLFALILWPACFGFAGAATARLARDWFLPASPVIAVVGWMTSVFAAWGCQAIALQTAMARNDLVSGVKESALYVALRQGPWSLGVVAAFGSVFQLVALVPHPSWITAGLTSILTAITFSYLGTLIGTALLSVVSGPEPEELRTCLRDLSRLTGISFSRVIYLDSTLSSGLLCEVRPHWRGHALAISKWTFDVLSVDERLAVLAHEAGHLRQHYLWKDMAVRGVLSAACVLVVVGVNNVFHLGGLAWAGAAAVATVLNWMVHAAFRRWLERDADRYATQLVGVAPMIAALEKLAPQFPTPSALLSHYDSFDVRSERIRSAGY